MSVRWPVPSPRTVPERPPVSSAYPTARAANVVGGQGLVTAACSPIRHPPPVSIVGPTVGARRSSINPLLHHTSVNLPMTPDVRRTPIQVHREVSAPVHREVSGIPASVRPGAPQQVEIKVSAQVSTIASGDVKAGGSIRSPVPIQRFISARSPGEFLSGSVTPMPPHHQPQQQAPMWVHGTGSPQPSPKASARKTNEKSPVRSPPRAHPQMSTASPLQTQRQVNTKANIAPILGSPTPLRSTTNRYRSPIASPQRTPMSAERQPQPQATNRALFQFVPASNRLVGLASWESHPDIKRMHSAKENYKSPERFNCRSPERFTSSPAMSPPKVANRGRATSNSPLQSISRSTTELAVPRALAWCDSDSTKGLPRDAVQRQWSTGTSSKPGASLTQSILDESDVSIVWEPPTKNVVTCKPPSNRRSPSRKTSPSSTGRNSSNSKRKPKMNITLGPSKSSIERRRLRQEQAAKEAAKRQNRSATAGSFRPAPLLKLPQASTIWTRRHCLFRGQWPGRGPTMGLHAMSTQLREILSDTVLCLLDDEMADVPLNNIALALCNRALWETVYRKYAPLIGSLRWKVRRALRPGYICNSSRFLSAGVGVGVDHEVKLDCFIKVADVMAS